MIVHRVSRAQMDANHEAFREARALPAPATVKRANVRVVLELGSTVFVLFRGRSFGVPPVGWRLSQELLAIRHEAEAAARDGMLTPETAPDFYKSLGRVPRLLWRHVRPVGWWQRALHRVGLMRNPFQEASEAELVELVDFFFERRTRSLVGFQSAPASSPALSLMSSTTSRHSA